jgi:hypothetical protein
MALWKTFMALWKTFVDLCKTHIVNHLHLLHKNVKRMSQENPKPDLTRSDIIKLIAVANKPLKLKSVNLSGVDLSCLDLIQADLTDAEVSGAYLVDCYIGKGDVVRRVPGIDFRGIQTRWRWATMHDAINNVRNAKWNENRR